MNAFYSESVKDALINFTNCQDMKEDLAKKAGKKDS